MLRKEFSRGFTLIEIMIVVAVIGILSAIAIPNMLRARLDANETAAQKTLKAISDACELYAVANNGNYPTQMSALTNATPRYITIDYTLAGHNGYNFACDTLTTSAYSCTATPIVCRRTGARTFTITSNAAAIMSADCD